MPPITDVKEKSDNLIKIQLPCNTVEKKGNILADTKSDISIENIRQNKSVGETRNSKDFT